MLSEGAPCNHLYSKHEDIDMFSDSSNKQQRISPTKVMARAALVAIKSTLDVRVSRNLDQM